MKPTNGDGGLGVRTMQRLKKDDLLAPVYAPKLLRDELDGIPLWKDGHVEIRDLAEYYTQYLYLSRLTKPEVLQQTTSEGLASTSWAHEAFAYADAFDAKTGRYSGLTHSSRKRVSVDEPGLLVHPDKALEQINTEASAHAEAHKGEGSPPSSGKPGFVPSSTGEEAPEQPISPTRFYGEVELDPAKLGLQAGTINAEVLAHLTALLDAEVKVILEVRASSSSGFDEQVIRTVRENCNALRFHQIDFDAP